MNLNVILSFVFDAYNLTAMGTKKWILLSYNRSFVKSIDLPSGSPSNAMSSSMLSIQRGLCLYCGLGLYRGIGLHHGLGLYHGLGL